MKVLLRETRSTFGRTNFVVQRRPVAVGVKFGHDHSLEHLDSKVWKELARLSFLGSESLLAFCI